jgi:hypothetical protein
MEPGLRSLPEQFLVRALFDEAAMIEHKDPASGDLGIAGKIVIELVVTFPVHSNAVEEEIHVAKTYWSRIRPNRYVVS